MNSISAIAGSAITAYGVKQAVTANNIANINTQDFKSSSVTFQEKQNGGVDFSVNKGSDSVDISKEAVDLINNSNGFKANIKVLQANDEMTKEILNIKA